MKQAFFLCYIGIFPLFAYAQECVIANSKENNLYTGLANPIEVAVNGYMCNDFVLATDNGKIEPSEEACGYTTIPERPGFANISVISKDSKKTIGKIKFHVNNIPMPVALINRKTGGEIAKNVFIAQIGLSADILNMDIDARIIVTGFNMTIFRNNQVIVSGYCDSAIFSDGIKAAINKTEIGDRVLFSNISYKGIATYGHLQPIEFAIVE